MQRKTADLKQVGVTKLASEQLRELVENKDYFANEQDVYRLGAATAIALGATISDGLAREPLAHKFRVSDDYSDGRETSRLDDPKGRFAKMISAFRPEYANEPYRHSQYLASIGINYLHGQIFEKGKTLVEALQEASARTQSRGRVAESEGVDV